MGLYHTLVDMGQESAANMWIRQSREAAVFMWTTGALVMETEMVSPKMCSTSRGMETRAVDVGPRWSWQPPSVCACSTMYWPRMWQYSGSASLHAAICAKLRGPRAHCEREQSVGESVCGR
eukprot:Gregarina_sp_Pseudo_9__916@NODE_1588_length_1475_cov_31_533426_g1473_i0_p3_GENE_NODE_1588_length_1475_cov_31_533426_g1473_i0NODE_1588_length_1475_cov_31_533426_g1473_i0_p3_ORF_typecomplete_len121_score12_37_NODE_1588_length_1475_cov_31_533426_g1473_i08431205